MKSDVGHRLPAMKAWPWYYFIGIWLWSCSKPVLVVWELQDLPFSAAMGTEHNHGAMPDTQPAAVDIGCVWPAADREVWFEASVIDAQFYETMPVVARPVAPADVGGSYRGQEHEQSAVVVEPTGVLDVVAVADVIQFVEPVADYMPPAAHQVIASTATPEVIAPTPTHSTNTKRNT